MVTTEQNVGLDISFTLNGETQRFHFDAGKIKIGRRRDCEVVIKDSSISRLHATAEFENGRWVLRDNNSSNGVAVNHRLVQVHMLGNDRVQLGDVTVQFDVKLPVAIGDEVLHSEQRMSAAIDVNNLDSLFENMLQPGESGAATQGATAQTSLSASEIILIMRAATDAFLSHNDLDSILEKVLDLIFDHLPVNQASVLLFDEDQTQLIPRIQRSAKGAPQQIRMSRHIANAAVTSKQAVLVMDAEQDPRFDAAASIISLGIRSAMCAPLCHQGRVSGLIYVDRRARNIFTHSHLEVLSILAGLSAAAVERALLQAKIERERDIRERLSRYHAPAVVDRIIQADDTAARTMTAEEREVTVLFADICGFTTLSEDLPAREVTALLNEIFEALTEEVFREGGTLDKFIGDAVMVFFGAPLSQPDHAARAVRVALAMQRRVAELNDKRANGKQLGLRIGINTGSAVVGDVGAHQRKDYTVIGDTVNTACRIEGSVATEGDVVIGSSTYALVNKEFDCRELPLATLRGKALPIQPYLVQNRS